MLPSPQNVHRGRYFLLLFGLYLIFFIGGMIAVGSLGLSGETLRWWRMGVIALCWFAAYALMQLAARRGRPTWLIKSPPA